MEIHCLSGKGGGGGRSISAEIKRWVNNVYLVIMPTALTAEEMGKSASQHAAAFLSSDKSCFSQR